MFKTKNLYEIASLELNIYLEKRMAQQHCNQKMLKKSVTTKFGSNLINNYLSTERRLH